MYPVLGPGRCEFGLFPCIRDASSPIYVSCFRTRKKRPAPVCMYTWRRSLFMCPLGEPAACDRLSVHGMNAMLRNGAGRRDESERSGISWSWERHSRGVVSGVVERG